MWLAACLVAGPGWAERDLKDTRSRSGNRTPRARGGRRLRDQPLRRRSAVGQADPNVVRRRRPAVDRQQRDLSAGQAGPAGRRQNPRARRHRRRRPGRQNDRVCPTACSFPPPSSPATAAPTWPTARKLFSSKTPTATARPTRAASCSRASAPKTRTTSCIRCAGAGRNGCISISRSTSIVMWKRPRACAGSAAAEFGSSAPRRSSWKCSLRGHVESLGPRLGPLGPIVRHRRRRRPGHSITFPGATFEADAGRTNSGRAESGQPQILRTGNRRQPAACPTTGKARSSPATFGPIGFAVSWSAKTAPALPRGSRPMSIKTAHAAFRPVDMKQGPDGAIYIADWYNPIIQHGEVDFRDPRRDHTHGRIWRLTAKGRRRSSGRSSARRPRRHCWPSSNRPRAGRGNSPSACSRSAEPKC